MATRRVRPRPAFVALLVVLAGCGGVAQGPETPPGRTVTPAPVPTDSPTPGPERASVPAPLTGPTPNATALARRHAESLSRRSYRFESYVGQAWGEDPDRSIQDRLDRRSYRVQSGGTYRAARVLLVFGSGPTSRLPRWEAYADGEAEYRQVTTENGTRYERRSLAPAALPPHQGLAVAKVVRYLDVAEATVERVATERGPRLRVVGREPRAPGLENVSGYRVEAIVTGTGRVEILEAAYVLEEGLAVRSGFRVRDVGSVRVDPPDWYGEARAETLGIRTPPNGSGGASGRPTTTDAGTPSADSETPSLSPPPSSSEAATRRDLSVGSTLRG